MESHKTQHEPLPAAATPAATSCQKKKNKQATFLEDLKDHIDDFLNASMDDTKRASRRPCRRCLECQRMLLRGVLTPRKLRVLCPFKPQWQNRTSSLAIYRQIS